jgi:GT2 family glycosyltransferase
MLLFFGTSRLSLRIMPLLFYGNLECFINKRHTKFGTSVKEGFSGCNILMKRSVLNKIGMWDERIQGADFDIFLRVKKRSMDVGDIKPIHLMLGLYMHHYMRLTLRTNYPPFKDMKIRMKIEDKWGEKEANELLKSAEMVL